MILDIPPHLETAIIQTAQAQGISATEWALMTLQNHATPSDDGIEFDMACMARAIGEYDKNGRAINTTEIPKGLAKDFNAFHQWIMERRA